MSTEPDDTEDPRILEVAREYLADLEAGRRPDREAYLARHPDLAGALADCLDGIDLANAAGLALRAASPPDPAAAPLGDFRIIREIGRGGMGVVYEARQLSLGRRVALKVLPFAAGMNPRDLQRFQTEAHAAAQLHHSNIVPVYAVGCERGTHFYAMQYIDGLSLDALIRAAGGPEGADTQATAPFPEAPSTATRAAQSTSRPGDRGAHRRAATIAAQVADALEYAHEAGVIHRDIKPANLLLDAAGKVWVTDFGLAQVSADAGVTQTGEVLGTLRYMSPEQAAGRRLGVDHRADVYSLGATLYELLTLRPALPARDRAKLLHQIFHEDPLPLREHDRTIPAELETIVLKAMSKSPADRYATAGEMAADLRRFLEDRPVLARRPTTADRARKWLRRHPSVAWSGVLLLAFGAAGLGVTTAVVSHQQALTQAAYQREQQRADQAEERFQLARRSADEMIRLAQEEAAGDPRFETLRRRMLESALAYYQEFIEQRRDRPEAQPELVAIRDQVEHVLSDLAVLRGDRHLALLGEPAVLEDLGLDDEQRKRVRRLTEQMNERRRSSFVDFHRLTDEERSRRFIEVARANEADVGSVLSPNQLARLGQVALQARGPDAFRDGEVVAALRLTADQRNQINLADGDRGPRRLSSSPQERVERILGLLTPAQRRRWEELVGPPCAGLKPFGPPPGVRPGPPKSPSGPPR